MYNSMPRDLVEVNQAKAVVVARSYLGSPSMNSDFQGPFARVEKREDQLEVFLKYAGLFGVPEVLSWLFNI